MMKISKLLIAYILTVWSFIMIFLLTLVTGIICISYHGFAIDENENIYLGKGANIEVLNHEGEVLRNVSSYTSRGYKFTIASDNTIIISTGDCLYQTDLFGNLIDKKVISDDTEDELVGINGHEFITSDGTVYVMKNSILRTYIYRLEGTNKTVIYKMPVFDYIMKLLAIICFLSILIVVPICIIKYRKSLKTT